MNWKEITILGMITVVVMWITLLTFAYNYFSDKLYVDARYTHATLPGHSFTEWTLTDKILTDWTLTDEVK